MKKTFSDVLRVLFFMLMPPLIIALLIYLVFFNTTYLNFVIVEEETVDNSYNNCLANNELNMHSNLAKIGGKLYYSYSNNDSFKYGTYDISSFITKRIYWEGISSSPVTLNLDVIGNEKILFNAGNGSVEFYDTKNGKYMPLYSLDHNQIDNNLYLETFFIDGYQYWYSGEGPAWCSDGYKIYRDVNGKLELIFSTDVISADYFGAPQFDDRYIYLEAGKEDKFNISKAYFYKYDILKKQVINRMQIDINNHLNSNIVTNDKIYSISGIYNEKSDENDTFLCVSEMNTKKQKKILSTTGTQILNGYNNLVCIGVNESGNKNGLYVIDIKTDEVKKIYDEKAVYSIYIVDNQWIYFTDQNEKLYRITPDGKTIEKVFG